MPIPQSSTSQSTKSNPMEDDAFGCSWNVSQKTMASERKIIGSPPTITTNLDSLCTDSDNATGECRSIRGYASQQVFPGPGNRDEAQCYSYALNNRRTLQNTGEITDDAKRWMTNTALVMASHQNGAGESEDPFHIRTLCNMEQRGGQSLNWRSTSHNTDIPRPSQCNQPFTPATAPVWRNTLSGSPMVKARSLARLFAEWGASRGEAYYLA